MMTHNRMEQRVRLLPYITAGLALALVVVLTAAFIHPPNRHLRFEEITVGRLNIAGADSVQRIILSHTMPMAPFQGERMERSVPQGMAGIIYCAANGDEVGGVGVAGTKEGGAALVTLDYRNTPLEAIGLATHYDEAGQAAGLVIMDPPRGTVDMKKLAASDTTETKRLQDMMVNRVELWVDQNDAALTIRDRKGNARIMIGVDKDDQPSVRLLDSTGKEIGRLP